MWRRSKERQWWCVSWGFYGRCSLGIPSLILGWTSNKNMRWILKFSTSPTCWPRLTQQTKVKLCEDYLSSVTVNEDRERRRNNVWCINHHVEDFWGLVSPIHVYLLRLEEPCLVSTIHHRVILMQPLGGADVLKMKGEEHRTVGDVDVLTPMHCLWRAREQRALWSRD